MQPQPYDALSELELLSLCVWREARGEGLLAKRGVAHTVVNRAARPTWWGDSIRTVILHPFQYSSFNEGDPNSNKWPQDNDAAYSDSFTVSEDVMVNGDEDITGGAVSYYDISIEPPYWARDMIFTIALGRLRFFKEG